MSRTSDPALGPGAARQLYLHALGLAATVLASSDTTGTGYSEAVRVSVSALVEEIWFPGVVLQLYPHTLDVLPLGPVVAMAGSSKTTSETSVYSSGAAVLRAALSHRH